MKNLFIINGTLGVGKSTIASALSEQLDNSYLIEGDEFSKFENFDVYDKVHLSRVIKNFSDYAVKKFHQGIHNIVIDYVFENPNQFEYLNSILSGVARCNFFYLRADRLSLEKRIENRNREQIEWEKERTNEILNEQGSYIPNNQLGKVIDTCNFEIKEIIQKILSHLYRENVAAFVIDSSNNFLFCHRRDVQSENEGFQIPQGGVEGEESFEDALRRELYEETGISEFEIIGKAEKSIRYRWHKDTPNSPYIGQEQRYYLVRINENVKHQLFSTDVFNFYKWVDINTILNEIIDFKKPVYIQAWNQLKKYLPEVHSQEKL